MGERHVRDDAERFVRQEHEQGVAAHHVDRRRVDESRPQARRETRVQLDGYDPRGAGGELVREHAGAGTDLDDEIAARYPGIPDEVSGEARDEEVLTTSGW